MSRIRLHDLRHTHATLLLEAGEPLYVVAERLGHANSSTTANIYAHVTERQRRQGAETFRAGRPLIPEYPREMGIAFGAASGI